MHLFCLIFILSSLSSSFLSATEAADDNCNCGIENVTPRIINGRRSKPYTFPWVVYIEKTSWFSGGFKCTGSVISPYYILTAAHCVPEDGSPKNMKVYTYQGTCGINYIRSGPSYRVSKIIRNKEYSGEVSGGNDIALIRLNKPIPNAMPICLPKKITSFKNLIVAGFGIENKGYEKVDNDCLNEVELDTVSQFWCFMHYRGSWDKVMCAGGKTGVCQGDSGGPLMSRLNGVVYQAGITSFTRADCGIATGTPAGFEKIVPHIDWIRKNTDGTCFK